jgi:hypothetical protein
MKAARTWVAVAIVVGGLTAYAIVHHLNHPAPTTAKGGGIA